MVVKHIPLSRPVSCTIAIQFCSLDWTDSLSSLPLPFTTLIHMPQNIGIQDEFVLDVFPVSTLLWPTFLVVEGFVGITQLVQGNIDGIHFPRGGVVSVVQISVFLEHFLFGPVVGLLEEILLLRYRRRFAFSAMHQHGNDRNHNGNDQNSAGESIVRRFGCLLYSTNRRYIYSVRIFVVEGSTRRWEVHKHVVQRIVVQKVCNIEIVVLVDCFVGISTRLICFHRIVVGFRGVSILAGWRIFGKFIRKADGFVVRYTASTVNNLVNPGIDCVL
mmetsp:Transcript_3140/g.7448  ORF Transcript_3140/g.7448 Transcript_3140/m.7448 type:complete len:273 (-) Transcript_3140:2240-3058(-)